MSGLETPTNTLNGIDIPAGQLESVTKQKMKEDFIANMSNLAKLDILSQLVGILPPSKDNSHQLRALTQRFGEMGDMLTNVTHALDERKVTSLIYDQARTVHYYAAVFAWDSLVFARDISEQAKDESERREGLAESFSKLSYFLYSIGWGVAFWGRLWGAEPIEGFE